MVTNNRINLETSIEIAKSRKGRKLGKFGICFQERKKHSLSERSTIYIVLRHNKAVIKRSTNIYCIAGTFNTKTLIINNDSKSTSLLQKIKGEAEQLLAEFRITNSPLNLEDFFNVLFYNSRPNEDIPTFANVLKGIIKEYEDLQGIDYSKKTVSKMRSVYERYIAFLRIRFGTSSVSLLSIKPEFITSFYIHLRKEYSLADESIRKYMQFGKKAFIMAIANNWCSHNPFLLFKAKPRNKPIEHLTLEEVALIEFHDFENDAYKEIQSMFLFQCYTGIDYGDLLTLTPFQIHQREDGIKFILRQRDKSGNEYATYLTDKAIKILEQFANHPIAKRRGTCFPTPSNQHYNRVLKEIGSILRIQTPITSHLARKTFVTTLFNKGVSKEAVQYAVGHKSLRTTEMYYGVMKKDRVLDELKVVYRKENELSDKLSTAQ